MVNKKGFIRTLEAVIAIVLILSLIIYLTPTRKIKVGVPSSVKEAKEFILKEILVNSTLRRCISESGCKSACDGDLFNFLEANKPLGYEYECEICDFSQDTGCGDHNIEKDVYSGAIFLMVEGNPRTFRLFLYEK